jgi:predicted PhzF superfamily epimerase YddE/YHI9
MAHRLFMVDVFAERRFSGNPLAVVIVDGFLSAKPCS